MFPANMGGNEESNYLHDFVLAFKWQFDVQRPNFDRRGRDLANELKSLVHRVVRVPTQAEFPDPELPEKAKISS